MKNLYYSGLFSTIACLFAVLVPGFYSDLLGCLAGLIHGTTLIKTAFPEF